MMRIAAYCRVSTDHDEQLESLENQKIFFEQYAKAHNYRLIKIYADEGISGKQIKNRTEFLNMLRDSKCGLFDMVVVKDISRFARNTVDFLNAIRQLKSDNIEVQFLSNNQTVLGNSEFILTIFSALAQEESANLSKRVKFGKKINAKKGRVPSIIYGYNHIDNFTLEINPQEAQIVKEIFNRYISGYGSRKIALDLNSRGIPSKKNTHWSPKVIRRILSNSIYCGVMTNAKYEVTDYLVGKKELLPEEQHLVHIKPEYAVINKEIYNKAQEIIKERQNQYKPKETYVKGRYSNKHIFSTLIKCEHCGYSFTRKHYKYKNERIYWKCTGNDQYGFEFCDNNITLNEDELLKEIRNYFFKTIDNEDEYINRIIKDYNLRKKADEKTKTIALERKMLSKLRITKEKYKTMFTNDIITLDELKEKVKQIDDKLEDINNQISELNLLDNISPEEKNRKLINAIKSILSFESITNVDMKETVERITANKNGDIHISIKNLIPICSQQLRL